MKTQKHYFSLQPVKPEPTYRDLIKGCVYVSSVFILTVLLLAGVDLIDQLLLWLK